MSIKHRIALLLGILVLLTALTAAASAEVGRLVTLVNGAAYTWANAVQLANGEETVWLTVASSLDHGGELWLASLDGYTARITGAEELGGSGLAVLTLSESTFPSAPYPLSTRSAHLTSREVSGYLVDASFMRSPVSRMAAVSIHGRSGLTFEAADKLLPGAALTDARGSLTGIVLGSWGEGEGFYVAVDAAGITDSLQAADRTPIVLNGITDAADEDFTYVTELNTQAENCVVTVTWDAKPDKFYRIWVADPVNDYYTTHFFPSGQAGSWMYAAVPGSTPRVVLREYSAELSASASEIDSRLFELVGIPVEVPRTDAVGPEYAFSQECWMSVQDPAVVLTGLEELEPADTASVQGILGGTERVCLQVVNHYRVTEEIQDNMIFVVTSPDGIYYTQFSGFIYMPSIMERDVWNTDLTPLFQEYEIYSGGLKPGEYRIAYYIGSALAGETRITLTGTAAEPETKALPGTEPFAELALGTPDGRLTREACRDELPILIHRVNPPEEAEQAELTLVLETPDGSRSRYRGTVTLTPGGEDRWALDAAPLLQSYCENPDELPAGIYVFTLLVDGRVEAALELTLEEK